MTKAINWFVNQPYLLLTLCAMMWGGNAVAGKLAVGHISPALLTSLRWFFTMMVIMPFAYPHLKRELPGLRPHLPFLFLLGTAGFTIFNNVMYLALNYTSAINVGIEQAAMPLVVFILNFLLFRIKTTSLQIIGFTLTLIGVIIIVTNGNPMGIFNQTMNFGDLIMMLAVLAYGGYSVGLRQKPQMHWLSFIAILGTSALISSLFFTAYEWYSNNVIWPDYRATQLIVYIVIFPSILAQTLWIRGLELIGSSKGGVFINLVPIFGASFAILFLGESFHLYHGVALTMVVGGVALAQAKRKGDTS